MAWTYSGDPATSDKDSIRFWVQDTDPEFPLLQDEEIQYLYDKFGANLSMGDVYVAALCAEILSNRFGQEVSVSADGVSVQVSELQDRFNSIAANLRDQWHHLSRSVGSWDMAGIFLDQTSRYADVKPLVFGVGFMDNALAGLQDFGFYSPGDYGNWFFGDPDGDGARRLVFPVEDDA